MRAHMASNANVGENPFSGRGQNRPMIAEARREIKGHARPQPLRWPKPLAHRPPAGSLPVASAHRHSEAKAGPNALSQCVFRLHT
jgi:hypothetical protein